MRWSLAVALLLTGCLSSNPGDGDAPPVATPEPGTGLQVGLELVLAGFDQPLLLTHDGSASYVVEQCGTVQRLDRAAATLWLDIRARVSCGGERGLLGLAFPADHHETGRYYVAYTDTAGDSVLSRFVGDDEEVLLSVLQPASNHNGGNLAFGPDGMLYYGLGDGGSARDAFGQAQDPRTLLGSLLRLDVSGSSGYRSPSDNPFVGDGAGADEVWAYGLRNPWRFSFDEATGDLWIGDVGQNAWEEINVLVSDAPAPANFGWPIWEASHRQRDGTVEGHTFPVAEYARADGDCSVTGGYVYHGPLTALDGKYVLGDFCSGIIRVVYQEAGAWVLQDVLETSLRISSFGVDAAGLLYVVDHQGALYRFVDAAV